MMTDPSGEFTIMEFNASQTVNMIISMIVSVKLHGFLVAAVQTVWGIPKDGTAFNNPSARVEGHVGNVNVSGLGFLYGREELYHYEKQQKWCYSYYGSDFSFSPGMPSLDVDASYLLYDGEVYNLEDKVDYTGAFFSISVSTAIKMFGSLIAFIPLNATIFSSGRPTKGKYGSYGWVKPPNGMGWSTSSGFSISASITDYKTLDENCIK